MKKLLIIIFIVLIALSGCKKKEDIEETEVTTPTEETSGPTLPDFELKNLEGEVVSSTEFEGKVLIVDFWATSCPPCVDSIPSLVEIRNDFHAEGMEIIGISLDEPRSIPEVREFVKKSKVTYPILIGDDDVKKKFGGVAYIPTMFIIDKDGNIRDKRVGYQEGDEDDIRARVEELLK